MQALKMFRQNFVLLRVLLKFVKHLEMLSENVFVCLDSEGDVNL
jgi:hypothetical protein